MPTDLHKILTEPAPQVARRLLGSLLVRELNGHTAVVKIVETEAYEQTDLASHSYRGKTERTKVMFGPAGHLYVYFTYGMHYCCNVVTGPTGHGAAVLVRGVEPIDGMELLQHNRHMKGASLTNGPAKLCQALAIDKQLNGHNLLKAPLQLVVEPALSDEDIVQTTRIGITQAIDEPWRFYLKNNQFVSKM